MAADLPVLEDLLDARELVEGMIARTAARRRTERDIDAIEQAFAAYVDAPTQQACHACDIGFHAAILWATHNPQLALLTQDLLRRVTPGLAIEPYSTDMDARALVEHRELVAAIVAGDEQRAGHVAEHHFTISSENTRRVLRRGIGPS